MNGEMGDEGLRGLVERASRREPEAWETLYRRAYRPLFAYARRRLPSEPAAEDAVSETMTRALDRIPGFTWKGAGFDAWLYGILRNVVLESQRSSARARPRGAPVDAPSGEPTPLDAALAREQHDEVRRAFERLSGDERELLELRVVGGLSAAGVGEVVGKRAGAVRMAQARALVRLRSLLEEVSGDR
ncbi:MAG: RNA polymerase sigma factor [Acidimicrobiales bacterium]